MARKIEQEYIVKDKGSAAIKTATSKINKSLDSVENTSRNITSKISSQWKTMAGVLAASLSIKAIADFSSELLTMGDRLDKLSQQVGTSVEFLSKLDQAAKLGGSNLERMSTGLRMMIRNLDMAERGTGDAAIQLKKYNINAKELIGLGTETALQKIAQAALSIEDPMQQANFLMGIFGTRIGTEIVPFLKDLASGLKGFNAEITGEQSTAFARFNDSLERLGSSMRRIGAVALKPVIDKLTEYSEAAEKAFDPNDPIQYAKSMENLNKTMKTFMNIIEGLLIIGAVTGAFKLFTSAVRGAASITGFKTVGGLLKAINTEMNALKIGSKNTTNAISAIWNVLKGGGAATALGSVLAVGAAFLSWVGTLFIVQKSLRATLDLADKFEAITIPAGPNIPLDPDSAIKFYNRQIAAQQEINRLRKIEFDQLQAIRKQAELILDETQKRARMTPGTPEAQAAQAGPAPIVEMTLKQADTLRSLQRELLIIDMNGFARRKKELEFWRLDQERIFKGHKEAMIVIADLYNRKLQKINNQHKVVQRQSFIALHDEMQQLRIDDLERRGKVFDAQIEQESLRFEQMKDSLRQQFSEQEKLTKQFHSLMEALEKDHLARIEAIRMEEFAASAGKTERTPGEQQRKDALEGIKKFEALVKKQEEKFNEMVARVSDFFADRFGDMWADWISGTKTLKDSFTDMVTSMMDDLARMAASAAFRQIFNWLGGKLGGPGAGTSGGSKFFADIAGILGFAAGGQVAAGQPIRVGERGPEVFTPGTSGRILPNGGGTALTINNTVNVSGQGAGASSQDQKRMGSNIAQMIATQTKMTIYNETRPGGILNRGTV